MEESIESKSQDSRSPVALTSSMPIMVPIIKIVGNYCNLRCEYCFYHKKEQQRKTVMNRKLLRKFLKEYMDLFNGILRFNWHGGEPLLAGTSFFESIIKFQRKYTREGQKIVNAIETNGTLIDDAWASFFKTHNFRIGVSIDGIQECHDQFRKDGDGQGSFDRVVQGIRTLQKYGVPLGIIQTLTHHNISDISLIKKNFNFFVHELGIKKIGFSLCSPVGTPWMYSQRLTNEELTRFFRTVIDLWILRDDSYLQIREIENFIAGVMKKQASLCEFNGSCSAFFTVDYNGEIYPCDRFSGRKEFLLGDLSKQSLLEILNGEKRLGWARKTNFLHQDCLECMWQKACHNGCTDCRNDEGKYLFCNTRKSIFGYLEKKIKGKEVEKWKEKKQ